MKNKGIRNRIDTSGGKTRKIALRSAIALSVALIVALIFFFAEDRVYAAEETVAVSEYSVTGYSDGSPLQITSAEDLRRFSNWYSQHADAQGLGSQYFSLDLQLAGSTYWNLYSTEYTYTSIGTASNPFWGKIKITGTNVNIFYSPVPLFGYLNQKTSFVDSDGNLKQLILLCSEKDNENKASSVPLLASHVVNPGGDGTAFSANVTIGYFDPSWDDYTNSTAKSFAGIIGEIGTGSDTTKVSLTVTNNGAGLQTANVANPSGAVGLLCQKINAGSELSATLNAGTNTNYSVTASGSGNYAGGLVGAMYSGSKLILSGTGLNTVTQSVSGTNAGGIVGYADNAYIDSEASDSDGSMTITPVFKAASTTLSGSDGNGYLFGYYGNTAGARKIKLSGFTGLTVSSTTQNAGGLIGVLSHKPSSAGVAFTIDGTAGVAQGASITQNLTATFSGSNNCGGVIGKYSTNDLSNTLVVTDVYAKVANGNSATTGGVVGYVDDSSSAAYIDLSKIYAHRTSGNSGGGLVGNAGNTNAKGAFVNVSGYNKVQGSFGAGLVNTINRGVLRIEGVTDLSSLSEGNYIVSSRNSALVYSPGTGNQTGTSTGEWRLIRQGHIADDIGSWGEVVRLNGFTANSVVDETNFASVHYVTLNSASTGGIDTLTKFALLALNIQLNTSNTSAALICSGTNSTALLASTISFSSSSSFDLSGTGITGLTRDNDSQTFTGTINGNGSTVTLAIGEAYGVDGSGNAVSNSNSINAGTGKIYYHSRNGLLSNTTGATVNGLTVNGTQWLGLASSICFGGITAQSNGGDTFDNVTSDVTVNVKQQSDITAADVAFGGFIGRTNKAASGTILFKDCATTSDFNDNTYSYVEIHNEVYKMESCFGGYIGLVDCNGDNTQNNALTVTFGTSGGTTPCAVGGSYTSEYSTSLNSVYGGLIGIVKGNRISHENNKRTINAYAVTVDGLAVNSKTNKASGGLLGYVWHDAEVVLQNVSVGGTSANTVEISGGSGKILTGLVYSATGHWSVDNVSIDRVTFTTPNSGSSLGLLVNSTVNDCMLLIDYYTIDYGYIKKYVYSYSDDRNTGLLLELKNKSHYVVTGTNRLSIDTNVTVFDEIAAYSKHPDNDDVCDNGNSVISINTDGSGTGVTMTGSSCNTYQNQSDYGKTTVTVNPNTRYYYNLDTIRGKNNPTDAEKLLLWSLSNYALGDSAKKYFDGTVSGASVSTISGNLDMEGLSYYPVDYSSVNFGTISHLKFYNEEIETAEGLSGYGNSDGITRSTTAFGASRSQHYSMHCGLFRNVSAGALPLTVTLPSISVEGNVGIIQSGSGFIVCGTLGGGAGVTTLDAVSGITLDGAYVSGASGSSFAPLLIANVDSNTVMNFTNVSSANYTTIQSSEGNSWYAATSLIGAVGKTDGSSRNMKPTFSEITLDSRKQDIAGADNSRFTAVYGSSRSIFKTATLLGHYYFSTSSDTESKGVYNYTYAEDWDGAPAPHNVTYGQEISSSEEYDGKQEKYNGDSHYTDPTSGSNTSAEYDFDPDYFLPYVGNYNSGNANYHELRVNHDAESLTEGCGTYNDPYVVDGGKLSTLSSILEGTMPPSTFKISLPDGGLTDKNASAVASGTGDINLLWCTGSSYHHDYYWDGANFTNGVKTYSKELVMAYLAGAYYVIEEDIEVSTGLSGSLAYTAFRGVIVGRQFTDSESVTRYPNVTITGPAPFIPTSNGCVIKNLNFIVDSGVSVELNQSLSADTAADTFQYGGGCQSYGVVIGKIMGGDNVIDNVGVTFNWSDGAISSVANAYIVPVGGYVGVVVNGGLFFRNMDLVPAAKKTGLTDAMFYGGGHIGDNNTTYLYHNPIIGRVINGYAVTESNGYVPSSTTQTMKNGTKNYAITDIDKSKCVDSSGVANATLDVTTSTINVPNDQAWFIMSCIVNSGTGSGSNTNQKMADNNISYSVTNYKTTHLGTYEDVGCGSYATKGKKDVDSVATSICDETVLFNPTSSYSAEMKNNADAVTPYIVYKYTTQSVAGANNFYKHYAKSLCGSARTIVMNPNGSGAVWTLPDGYRGIGGFNGSDNSNKNSTYNINVAGMTCNGTTINLNMKYQTYLYSATNSIKQENYYPVDNGFGLFNTIKISQAIEVSDLTLRGNVYIDTYDKATGEAKHDYGGDYNNKYATDCINSVNGRVSAGMFAGQKTVTTRLTLSNVALDSIDVHSSRAAGGMIGMANTVSIVSCPADNIKVLGRYDTGGYVGQLKGISYISGTSAVSKTGVSIDSVVQEAKGFNFKTSSGRNSGVGGIVGRYSKNADNDTLTIENLNITKYGSTEGKINYSLDSNDESTVGGILGGCDTGKTTVTIQNCDMTDVSVIGTQNRVGGVLGGTQNGPTVNIKNVVLDGEGSAVISVAARDNLGGIIGFMGSGTDNVENVVLKNYTIYRDPSRASATAPGKGYAGYGEGYVGGCIGYLENGTLNIRNFYIDNVTFSGICREKGCGGVVGYSKGGTVHGYNVALNSLTSTIAVNNAPTKKAYGGDIAGLANSKDYILVGFSRQDTPTNTLYGSNPSNNSYIIFSDYSGVGFDGDGNTSKPVFNGSEAANTVDANVPYATVNPVSSSGIAGHETILTGDGIAPSYNSSAIAAIKSDLAAGTETKRYTTVGTAVTNTINASNFSTFNTEWGEDTVENDFIVLLVEDSNRANITALINNYIKALTNQTKYSSFGADSPVSGNTKLIYKVNIYKMQYEEDGYFTKLESGVHLHKDGEQFYMSSNDPNDVDSSEEKPTFSLIDVAFYDPTVTSSQKVAYHLYIPVYVKKMLNFSFSINTASNTPYYPTAYYDNNLIDNLGAAGSLYFTYSYNRKVEEWQHALEYGENLLVNYNKILTMTKKGVTTEHFDDDMLIALVDRNDGGKVYYATFGDVFDDGKLTLYENGSSSFTTSIGSGTQFAPVTICDMLNISAQQNGSGKFVRIDPVKDGDYTYATVKVGSYYYRPVDSKPGSTDSSLGYGSGDRYNLSVINRAGVDAPLAADNDLNITESYYLSLFTVESNNPSLINYYNITSTKKLTGGSSAAKATAEPGSAEILFGNLFTQSDVTYQANYNGSNPDLISDSNKTIKVRLETTIELTDTAMSEISGLIGAGSVYQSFLVYMTKREGGSTKAILGDPTAFAEVEISPVNLLSAIPPVSVGSAVYPFGAAFTKVGNSYVEVNSGENIAGFLADGGATIVSLVHINYETQDDRMAQFAARASNAESEQLKYTSVSAESKIGFNEDTVAYSTTKSEAARVGLDMRYYIIASKRPTLAYNAYADADSDVYGQLGINANDLPDATGKVGVRTKAVYDISNIRNEVTGYGYVKVTFELRQKRQRYFDEYGDPLPIRTYMKNVNVAGSSATYDPVVYNGASYVAAGNAAVIYSFIVPRNEVETADCILEIPINFSVFTGTDVTEGEAASFEGKGLMYSNYRITISCEMLEHANDENGFTTSYATNYIVYTNAKLLTTFIRIE